MVTGQVTLLRYIVSEDCGPMINPSVVEGQIAGGTVQGIGGALFEHLAYDEDGNPVTTTFMDYLLPTAADVPIIEYGHIETPSPGPGGFKGVGEGGAIGAPPAVVNAVADALSPFGVSLTRLPLTPVPDRRAPRWASGRPMTPRYDRQSERYAAQVPCAAASGAERPGAGGAESGDVMLRQKSVV